jgi:hypothetical protein
MIIVNKPLDYSQHIPNANAGAFVADLLLVAFAGTGPATAGLAAAVEVLGLKPRISDAVPFGRLLVWRTKRSTQCNQLREVLHPIT